MKSPRLFIRATLTGGVLFLLPVVVLSVFYAKAHQILLKLSAPLAKMLPDLIFGFDGSNMVALVLLVLICFVSGLLFRTAFVRKWITKLEDSVLIYMPGYSLIKSITADVLGEQLEQKLIPILVQDGDIWNLGFLVETEGEWSTVFIPDAPRYDAGEIKIVPSHYVKMIDVTANKFAQSIKTYGKGIISLVK